MATKKICFFCLICLLGISLVTGCASKKTQTEPIIPQETKIAQSTQPINMAQSIADDTQFEDYEETDTVAIADPLEGWNRFWFGFNDVLLLKIIKPTYTGYSAITTPEIRHGLSNVLHNLQMPIRFANSLLQGKFAQAMVEVGRFVVNTTAGLGGIVDVTAGKKVLVPVDEQGADFGQTLACWGVGEGFYVVWPLLGPSTARDSVGYVGDYFASPTFWGTHPYGPVKTWHAIVANGVLRFNDFGSTIEAYEAITKGAVEPYSAMREAYITHRRARIK